MTRLDDSDRAAFVADHAGWAIEAETITRTFILADFNEAMGFVTRVAMLAEVADHHPDIDIRWNKVTLVLSTHDQGALTSNYLDLAARIDSF